MKPLPVSENPSRSIIVEENRAIRSAIVRFLLAGIVVLLIVAVPVSFWVRTVSRELAMDNVVELTQRLADYTISPVANQALMNRDPVALATVEERLAPWMSDGWITRIKIWSADGTILYSDVADLIGSSFPVGQRKQDLLAGGPATVSIGPQDEDENEFESHRGDLVEVYVISHNQNLAPMIFEVYFDISVVQAPDRQVLLGMIPVLLVSMAVLQGAQLVPGIRLAKQLQKRQRERRAILQRGIEAGERERVRLARDLHDDIIQDLAGLGYALESMPEPASGIRPSVVLQSSIQKLRAITSELYSSPVTGQQLPDALGLLVERTRSLGIRTTVAVDESLKIEDHQATVIHRIAREAMVNVIKHSHAKNACLRLERHGRHWRLTVGDDGVGFDTETYATPSHFGLRMMADIAETADARLELVSSVGGGTNIIVNVPAHSSALAKDPAG